MPYPAFEKLKIWLTNAFRETVELAPAFSVGVSGVIVTMVVPLLPADWDSENWPVGVRTRPPAAFDVTLLGSPTCSVGICRADVPLLLNVKLSFKTPNP